MSSSVLPKFSSKSLIVSGLTFRSLIIFCFKQEIHTACMVFYTLPFFFFLTSFIFFFFLGEPARMKFFFFNF